MYSLGIIISQSHCWRYLAVQKRFYDLFNTEQNSMYSHMFNRAKQKFFQCIFNAFETDYFFTTNSLLCEDCHIFSGNYDDFIKKIRIKIYIQFNSFKGNFSYYMI